MAHVAEHKKKKVQKFVDLINQYPIVGAVNMQGLPAPQLQKMRTMLRETVVLKMEKRRLLKIALEQTTDKKPGIEKLAENLEGMPALLFTKENPFKLYKKLKQNKSSAPAKGGQTAPKDIEVKAGATSFAPGPIIGELGAFGIKCGVEGGKIAIKEDSIVAKKGDIISPKLAEILTRLGIEPMEVGLDLVATYEDGTIFTKDVLDVDQDKFLAKLQNASRWAFNLSIEACIPTKDNIELLVSTVFKESKALALEANIMADTVAEEILTKAERQMISLKNTAKIETTKTQTAMVKEAEEKAESAPEVKEAKEKIQEDKEKLEKDMQKKVDNAPKEEKKELEAKKEVIEKKVDEQLQTQENEENDAAKVPSAHELAANKTEKVPTVQELSEGKN